MKSVKLLFCSFILMHCPLLFLAGNCVAEVECLHGQRSLLLDLKKGFTFYGDSLPSWKPGTNCCNWEGVTCDSESGRIIGLDLSGRAISGNISSSLSNLTSLQTLNLAFSFFDRIPIPQLETLANLTRLNLSRAGFAGQIPVGISQLRRLVSLDLSNYVFDTFLTTLRLYKPDLQTLVRNLTNLRELHLDSTDISYDVNWLHTLSSLLPRLEVLSLQGCNLQGILTKDIFQLKYLRVLDLSGNGMLSGALPDFPRNSALECLVLSYTSISGAIPDSIGNLRNLTRLEIRYAAMTGVLPDSVRHLKKLMRLEITNSMVGGVLSSSIGNLSQLVYLDLSSNFFVGVIPLSMGNLAHLRHLDLSANYFRGTIPPTIFKLVQLQHLDLTGNRFGGVISSSISNLTLLVYVDLSNNHFSGPLPSFAPQTGIASLVLSSNNFGGPIPLSYSGFRYIETLDLSFNSISESIPASLFSLPALQILNLGHNQLSGELEEFLNMSTSFVSIDLSYNQLQGTVSASFSKLSQLQDLNIASNHLSLELDVFESLTNLSSLDLSNNLVLIRDIDGHRSHLFPKLNKLRLSSCNLTKLPAFLRHQDTLFDLDISNNRIGGRIPKWVWSIGNGSLGYLNLSCNLFTSIEGPSNLSFVGYVLDLHSNMLEGPLPLPSAQASGLYQLDYSHNRFSSIIPPNIFSYFVWIGYFSLANNFLTGNIPESFCNMTSNEILDLSNNNLSGFIPQCLFQGPLLVLNLRGNQLQGSIPQNISRDCGLQSILLGDNHLQGRLPRSLVNCSNLLVFEVANNNIVDSFPFWLGSIRNLKALLLRANGFYGHVEVPKGDRLNSSFSELQMLDLSSNNFSGHLSRKFLGSLRVMMNSSELKYSTAGLSYDNVSTIYQDPIPVTSKGQQHTLIYQLTVLVSLDISGNDFEGEIPEAIGGLRGLQVLNFSRNAFTGKIPRSIGNLKQVESLDLSSNHLSGEIPQEMTSLTFLSYLNLSDNELTGRIPQSNQFSTFSNASFARNQGLCGSPLSKQCGDMGPKGTDTVSPLSYEDSTYVIGLALSVGVGFGAGMAGVLVIQNLPWKYWKKRIFSGNE